MDWQAILLSIGACLTGAAGVLTAWASLRRSKRDAAADCERELTAARSEAARNAADAHSWRMRDA